VREEREKEHQPNGVKEKRRAPPPFSKEKKSLPENLSYLNSTEPKNNQRGYVNNPKKTNSSRKELLG